MQDILRLKILENLCEGLIVKNYKEMTSLLCEEIKTGKSRQLQMKNWQRYFEYEKEGHKLIITKIYDEPIEKVDNRGKSEGSRNNNSIYISHIESILLYLLLKTQDKTLIWTKKKLLYNLGITSSRYIDKHTRKALIKSNAFKEYEIKEFDRRVYQILDRILFSALNNMQRRNLINYKKLLYYSKINEDTGEPEELVATEEEEKTYNSLKDEVLVQMGIDENKPERYKQLSDIYFHNKEEVFYDLLQDKAYDELGWDIAYTKYWIECITNDIQKENIQVQKEKLELNEKVMTAINTNAETVYKNKMKKYQIEYDELCLVNECDYIPFWSGLIKAYHPPKNYVERQHMIAEELIRINNKSHKMVIYNLSLFKTSNNTK